MQPIPRRILLGLLLISGLVWIWASRTASDQEIAVDPAPQAGFPAPNFNLETTAGEIIQLNTLRGQPVIINFWASWCPPCRAEMPALQTVYQEYSEGLVVLAVNATNQDRPTDILSFQVEMDLTIPVLLDVDGQVQRIYGVSSLPTTFFIDSAGEIQEVVVGGLLTEAGLRARIHSLLEDTP